MATASLGAIHKFGDIRAQYQFAIKDANSMISQLTDDDPGTATGVNFAVHGMRLDIGLTRYLQWQHQFYLQNAKSPSNAAEQFFVQLQRGAGTAYRYFDQLLFTF